MIFANIFSLKNSTFRLAIWTTAATHGTGHNFANAPQNKNVETLATLLRKHIRELTLLLHNTSYKATPSPFVCSFLSHIPDTTDHLLRTVIAGRSSKPLRGSNVTVSSEHLRGIKLQRRWLNNDYINGSPVCTKKSTCAHTSTSSKRILSF